MSNEIDIDPPEGVREESGRIMEGVDKILGNNNRTES